LGLKVQGAKMASPKMRRCLEYFFEKFTLPHWFINYNKTSRSASRGGKKDWPFWVFYIGVGYGHCLLLISYHLKYTLFSDAEIIVSQKSLRVILVLLFTSFLALVTASIYTIALNEAKFAKALSGICRFQANFEGGMKIQCTAYTTNQV
jgi:hypothetical protein